MTGQKALAGGVGGLITYLLLLALQHYGIDVVSWLAPLTAPADPAAVVSNIVGGVIVFLVPSSYKDIYQRINNALIARAMLDPKKPDVSLTGFITAAKGSTTQNVANPNATSGK